MSQSRFELQELSTSRVMPINSNSDGSELVDSGQLRCRLQDSGSRAGPALIWQRLRAGEGHGH